MNIDKKNVFIYQSNKFQVLFDCQLIEQYVRLRTEAQYRMYFVHFVAQIVAHESGRAFTGRIQPAQHERGRRLARPVMSNNSSHLVLVKVQRQILNSFLLFL